MFLIGHVLCLVLKYRGRSVITHELPAACPGVLHQDTRVLQFKCKFFRRGQGPA